ncbi:MAG: fructosamine kinase family protein [Caldilineaceae bacterium]
MQELLGEPLRLPIEQAVAAHIGRPWQVRNYRDLNDLSSHPAAILSDGVYAVFAKLSNAANRLEQFTVEVAGLQRLHQSSGVLTPTQIALLETGQGVIMLQEAVQTVERTTRQWQQIGESLARIHHVHGQRFGLETQGYFGPLYQDNRPLDDWATFYAERRLWPRLMSAIDAGHLPSSLIRQLEKLIARLPDLCGPQVYPTLLHGDAQQNNYISSAQGAVVIDPAVYYGHPEIDLAYLDYFQPVPDAVFNGYRSILPIDPGFGQRRDLWRIYGYLAIVTLDASYLDRLSACVRSYL